MSAFATSYSKKAIALVFIGLLLSIHVVKMLHRHDVVGFKFPQQQELLSARKATSFIHCPVCDFNISGDLVYELETVTPVPVFYTYTFIQYDAGVYLPAIDSIKGRGPPAFS